MNTIAYCLGMVGATLLLAAPSAADGLDRAVVLDLGKPVEGGAVALGEGWWLPEPDGRWTGHGSVPGSLRFTPMPGWDYDLAFLVHGVPTQTASEDFVLSVLLNGVAVGQFGPTLESSLRLHLNAAQLAGAGSAEVALAVPLFCPKDLGESPDDRTLGIKVRSIRVIPRRPHAEEGPRPVAIFQDPNAPIAGAPSDPKHLAGILNAAGIATDFVSSEALADPAQFHVGRYGLVILPYGEAFPGGARENVTGFLQAGGSFLSTGGYAFNTLYNDANASPPLFQSAFDTPLEGWTPSVPGSEVVSFAWLPEEKMVRATVTDAAPIQWYDLTTPVTGLTPGMQARVSLRIRTENQRDGYGAYGVLCYFDEAGERISCTQTELITGTRDWVRTEGNGAVPPGTVVTRLGLIIHGHGVAYFDDVRVEPTVPAMNTATGKGADFLELDPLQISAFDAGYPLRDVVSAAADPDQFMVPCDLRLTRSFEGWAAMGMLGEAWYCTCPDKARWTPLLRAEDRFGRYRGALGAVMHNYGGPYEGSIWAFFGADNTDLFSPEYPDMARALVALVQSMERRTYLHETKSDLACYRDGETVSLSVNVSNGGQQPRDLSVHFEILPVEGSNGVFAHAAAVRVEPGEAVPVTCTWTPGVFADDLYRIQTTLYEGETPMDRECTNGFVVWKPETFAKLPKLSLVDNVMRIGERPLFMIGAQQFWSSLSIRNSSPLVIAEDFKTMRDMGVGISRSFMMWALRPEQEERRFRDMMVYLAQKYGIVMFYEGIGDCPPATDDYAKELARADFVANTYGDLPLFCVDLRNEPVMRVATGERQQGWLSDFVAGKYAGAPPYGDAVPGDLSPEWGDLASYDRNNALLDYLANWTKVQADRLHAAKPDLLVSVGFLQNVTGPAATEYPVWTSDGLDFMDRHFYGDLANFPAQFKETDLRAFGMPPSVGEFGSKTHPGRGGNYESPEDQYNRYLFVSHYALGLGGIFVSNWHWRDPWENIFPYGLMHQDNVPKPVAKVYRAMGLLFASIRPRHETPEVYVVTPDRHRVSHYPLANAVYTALNALMDLHVDYGILPEGRLNQIPENARVLFYPLPFLSDEATLARLEAFVREGGTLYLSGDLGYDETLARSHGAFLPRLTGIADVRTLSTGLKAPLPEASGVTALNPALRNYNAAPILNFDKGDASVLYENSAGQPTAVERASGKGRVLFTADPMELRAKDLAASGLYGYVLAQAGVAANALAPDTPDMHCFRIPVEEGQAFVLYDRRPASITEGNNTRRATFAPSDTRRISLPAANISLSLAPMKPGFAHLDEKGALLAVETQGAVSRGGSVLIDTDTHVIALSLDGRDLAASEMVAIICLYPGAVDLASGQAKPRVEAGYIEGGAWRALRTSPPLVKDGKIELVVDGDTSLEILLVAQDMREARRRLLALAGFPGGNAVR